MFSSEVSVEPFKVMSCPVYLKKALSCSNEDVTGPETLHCYIDLSFIIMCCRSLLSEPRCFWSLSSLGLATYAILGYMEEKAKNCVFLAWFEFLMQFTKIVREKTSI